MPGGSSPSRDLNRARAAVDDAASWVTQHCTDEELALLDAARHQVLLQADSQRDRLHREADLLLRWSASLAVDEAVFLERI